MSGQYPGGFNSPVGGHRGQFNPQQLQQQMVNMNQMGAGGVGGMQQNPMGGPTQGGGMLPMGGGYAQGGMMQQQGNPMQGNVGGVMPQGGMGVMNPGGMQSPSHAMQSQQQMNSQQQQLVQQQQQMHLQQQQIGAGGPQMAMPPVGNVGLMQQQQHQQLVSQQQSAQQQQLGVGASNAAANATGGGTGILHQQQQTQAASNMLAISQPNPHKEINIVALSRLGQETVQDITSRFQEIFHALKTIQPTANRDNNTEKKVQEHFRTIRLLFKRLRIIYDKCNDGYPQGMEYTHVESLIPYKDEPDLRTEPAQCEEHRKALQENQELIETVKLKNRQLREIIDRTRIIIWEINTMLSMRRS